MPRHRRGRPHGARPKSGGAVAGAADAGWLHELSAIAADPSRWPALDEDTLLLIVFQQCLFFAHSGDAGAAEALGELYPHVAARVEPRERLDLLERVTSAVEEGGTPVPALLPFLQHEPDASLVALAAGSYATLAPLENGEPLSGPRAVLRMAEHAEDEGTRVGLLLGLLELGDRRVLPLLREGWALLPESGRVALAAMRPSSPMAFAATAEFWAGALADAEGEALDAVAGALARLAAAADPPRVLDVRRKLPAHADDDRETIEILTDQPLAEFAATLAGPIAAAEARAGIVALRDVRAAWGLPPA